MDGDNFILFEAGISNPDDLPVCDHGQFDNSSSHSCTFFDARVARIPNARSAGEAASILAFNLPVGEVKACRVVAGVRLERRSSETRDRLEDLVGDLVLEADLGCSSGGASLEEEVIIDVLSIVDYVRRLVFF